MNQVRKSMTPADSRSILHNDARREKKESGSGDEREKRRNKGEIQRKKRRMKKARSKRTKGTYQGRVVVLDAQ